MTKNRRAEDSRPNMVAGTPVQNAPASPEKGEKTVTMHFPRRVVLNHGGRLHEFQPGVHEVPESMADHYYLKDHGAVRHVKGEEGKVSLPGGKGGLPGSSPVVGDDNAGGMDQRQTSVSQRTSTEINKANVPSEDVGENGPAMNVGEPGEGDEGAEEEEENVEEMTKDQLIEYADSRQIEVDPDAKKADILKAIKKSRK